MRNKIYLAFILLPATQTLALTWTESVNGDLSDNASAPTNITFDVGVKLFLAGWVTTNRA